MKPDMSALEAYKEKHAEYISKQEHLDTLTTERDTQRASHDELRKKRLHEFMAGFQCHLAEAEGAVPDDHARRRRGARAHRQSRPVH